MALWDKLKQEFIDIIEWVDDTQDTMVYRFPRYQKEIKMGAQLTVREGQVAVFINEGQLADVYKPGRYELQTQNMPILTTLKGWKYGFNSPFKAEVYFVATRNFTDRKWGTKNPVMLRDPEFGPIRIRAFGNYALRVDDPAAFIREIVGTDGQFTTEEITDQLRNLIVTRFSDKVAESKIPILDMAANYDEMSKFLEDKIQPEFGEYGLKLTKFLIENISLPEKVEEALDKRSSMGIIGDLSKYTQYQAAEAMEAAAENPSGDAGAGIGMGMGFAMANQMAKGMNMGNVEQPQTPQTPPPIPGVMKVYVAIDGKREGPYNKTQLMELIAKGTLTNDTLVWQEGMAGWEKAAAVDNVKSLLGSVPPPLPPG